MTESHSEFGCGKLHKVWLLDDGTLDTVVEVDGRIARYLSVRERWLHKAVIEAWVEAVKECYEEREEKE